MKGILEGVLCDEGGCVAIPTTTAPSSGELSATLNGASIYILNVAEASEGQDQGRGRASRSGRKSSQRAADGGGPPEANCCS